MATGVVAWSKTAATNNTADSNVNWQEGQAPSTVNDSARAMMASIAMWRDDNNGSLTTAGTSTAYTLTTNQGFTSLSALANQTLAFTMSVTSGATPTLSVDSQTAKPIRNATGVALPTGALLAGSVYHVKYDTTVGEFLLINQPGVLPTNSVVTASITDANVTLAKIVNTTASRLLGNPTGSAAAPSEISLGAGLSFSGTSLVSTLDPAVVPGFIGGLTLSAAGGTGTFGIAAGAANDVSNGGIMALSSAYTKTTASWAVGSGNGGLDTGSIAANTWYHHYLIKRTDTGVVDPIFSLSASSPTMPSGYTLKRWLGALKTDGSSQWIAFTQTGNTFIWNSQVTDVSGVTLTSASRTLHTLTVPTGVVVEALFRAGFQAGGGSAQNVNITSPQESDLSFPNSTSGDLIAAASQFDAGNFAKMTNTSAQVGSKSNVNSGLFTINTFGWRIFR